MPNNITCPMAGDTSANIALGRQLTIEYYDCCPAELRDEHRVEDTMLKAARDSNATIISSTFHQFDPQGVSGVVIIAESHFTVHAWPEHAYAAVDIFTCGDSIDLDKAVQSLKDSFGANRVVVSSDRNRGVFSTSGDVAYSSESVNGKDLLPISWKRAHEQNNPWGIHTSATLYGCDKSLATDFDYIKAFSSGLFRHLDLVPAGDCRIACPDSTDCTMTRLGETAAVAGHFDAAGGRVFLDLLSRTFHDPRRTAEFALAFFKGSHYRLRVLQRD